MSVRIPAQYRRQFVQISVEKVLKSSSLIRKKLKKPLHENFYFGAQKFLTRRLLRTVLRKLSEFLCSTNVGPEFFPIDRPRTSAGSIYRRHLGKSVQFEAQTVGRRKSVKFFFSKTVSVRIPAQCRRHLLQISVDKVPQSSSLIRKKIKKPLHENFHFRAKKFLTRRLLSTVLRKLSEILCSTNVGPEFLPIHRPPTSASSMCRRHLGKSVKFEAQTIGRRKSSKNFFSKTVSVRIPAQCRRQLLQISVDKVPQSSSLIRKKIKKPLHENFHFGAKKNLTQRLLRTIQNFLVYRMRTVPRTDKIMIDHSRFVMPFSVSNYQLRNQNENDVILRRCIQLSLIFD